MKPRTVIPLIIGLGIGFFAIKLGVDMVQRAKGAQSASSQVLMGVKKIPPATRITEHAIVAKHVSVSGIPADAVTDPKQLIGRVTAMTIAPGIAITKSMLAAPGAEPGLRAVIPAGKRAVSVSVNEEASVAGFIMPGCHVDVSAVSRNSQSRLILSDVEVGAVGQSMSEVGPDGKTTQIAKSVTLFVQPEEVQVVHAFTGQGKIKLALRGDSTEAADGMWSRVLGRWAEAKAPPPAAPEPIVESPAPKQQSHVVEVIRGAEVQRIRFDESGAPEPVDRATENQSANSGKNTHKPSPE